jgi:hypothetical protein
MKNIFLPYLISICFNIFGQTYVLDTTFGDDGNVINNGIPFNPKDVLLINNNYFFISNNEISKVNYNGLFVNSFGINGIKSLNNSFEEFTILGFKFLNNAFYLNGTVKNLNTNNEDIFICKIDELGNFDSAFGNNGISKIDFGTQESLSNFCLDENGDFYCIGNKKTSQSDNRLIYFKINTNGSLITSFDSNGYKEFLINTFTEGVTIFPYNNNFILIGNTDNYIPYTNAALLIININTNGSIITSYGTNGYLNINLIENINFHVKKAHLLNNNLYISYGTNSIDFGDTFMKFNLTTNVVEFNLKNVVFYHNPYFKVDSDGLFFTHSEFCYNTTWCNRDFRLKKQTLIGTVDSNFQINGAYNYSFPHTFQSDEISTVFLKENNNAILIGGRVIINQYTIDQNNNYITKSGFSMIRLVPGTLSTNEENLNPNVSVFPNPFEDKISLSSESEIKEIFIYDISGRIILIPKFQFNNNLLNIDLSNILLKGVYILKIKTSDNKIITKKIIKK